MSGSIFFLTRHFLEEEALDKSLRLRREFLRRFPLLHAAPHEQAEALEQLRALWHGYRIAVHISDTAPQGGVDTPEDLARVRAFFASSAG